MNTIAVESFLFEIYPMEYLSLEGAQLLEACEADAKSGTVLSRIKERVAKFVEWIKKLINTIRAKIREFIQKIKEHRAKKNAKPAPVIKVESKSEDKPVEKTYKLTKSIYTMSSEDTREMSTLLTKMRSVFAALDGSDIREIVDEYIAIAEAVCNAISKGSAIDEDVSKYRSNDAMCRNLKNRCAEAREVCERLKGAAAGETKIYHSDVEEEKTEFDKLFDASSNYDNLEHEIDMASQTLSDYEKFLNMMQSGVASMNAWRNANDMSSESMSAINTLISAAVLRVNAFQEASSTLIMAIGKAEGFRSAFGRAHLYTIN